MEIEPPKETQYLQYLPKELFLFISEHLHPKDRAHLFSTSLELDRLGKYTYYPEKFPTLRKIEWYKLLFRSVPDRMRFNHLVICNLKKFNVLCNKKVDVKSTLAQEIRALSMTILTKIKAAQQYYKEHRSDPEIMPDVIKSNLIYVDWLNITNSRDSLAKKMTCTFKKKFRKKSQPLIPLMNFFLTYAAGEVQVMNGIPDFLMSRRIRDDCLISDKIYLPAVLKIYQFPNLIMSKQAKNYLQCYAEAVHYFIENNNHFLGIASEAELHNLIFKNWNSISAYGTHRGPYILYDSDDLGTITSIKISGMANEGFLSPVTLHVSYSAAEIEGCTEELLQKYEHDWEVINDCLERSEKKDEDEHQIPK